MRVSSAVTAHPGLGISSRRYLRYRLPEIHGSDVNLTGEASDGPDAPGQTLASQHGRAGRHRLRRRSTDPLGRHPWYRAQALERQIEIGKWRQANVAKVGLQFEIILIRGLTNYAFWVPNGSPEYRYCLHESVEECNHTMMFQEMVNRIGADVPGMPRSLRWVAPF